MGVLRHESGSHRSSQPSSSDSSAVLHVDTFRAAVDDLLTEVAGSTGTTGVRHAESVLARRLGDDQFSAVLTRAPDGMDGVVEALTRELRSYRPNERSAAIDLTALIRIFLLSQIDAIWWRSADAYAADADMLTAGELVDLEPLRRRGLLTFS